MENLWIFLVAIIFERFDESAGDGLKEKWNKSHDEWLNDVTSGFLTVCVCVNVLNKK